MKRADCKLVSHDLVFARYQGGEATADTPERKLYVPTKVVEHMPWLEGLFDRSKCENVVVSQEDCDRRECPAGEGCPIERGAPYCFMASGTSRAMLDPWWLGGTEKHARRTKIEHVILLRRDSIAPEMEDLDADVALRYVEEGRDHRGGTVPFMNPHLLVRTMERYDLQRRYFRRLFKIAPVTAVNVGRLTVKEAHDRIRGVVGS
jgi:hypothetical protein